MAYLGKTFTLESQERFDEFLVSLGVPKEQVDAMINIKATEVLEKNGDEYTLTLSRGVLKFKPGVEFEDTVYGNKVKITFVVDGDTITETEVYPSGRTLTFKKEYSDNKLVVTCTNSGWDGVAVRTFTA